MYMIKFHHTSYWAAPRRSSVSLRSATSDTSCHIFYMKTTSTVDIKAFGNHYEIPSKVLLKFGYEDPVIENISPLLS